MRIQQLLLIRASFGFFLINNNYASSCFCPRLEMLKWVITSKLIWLTTGSSWVAFEKIVFFYTDQISTRFMQVEPVVGQVDPPT